MSKILFPFLTTKYYTLTWFDVECGIIFCCKKRWKSSTAWGILCIFATLLIFVKLFELSFSGNIEYSSAIVSFALNRNAELRILEYSKYRWKYRRHIVFVLEIIRSLKFFVLSCFLSHTFCSLLDCMSWHSPQIGVHIFTCYCHNRNIARLSIVPNTVTLSDN